MEQNPNNLPSLIVAWFPTMAYCVVIFYVSSHELPVKADLFPLQDKLLHFIEYGVLSLLVFFSFRKSMPDLNVRAVAVFAILFSGLYGISDEIHQYFVPGRDSSIDDVIADFMGALVFQCRHFLKH